MFGTKLRFTNKSGLVALVLTLASCTKEMAIQPKFLPGGETSFYADHRTMREPIPGTIATDDMNPQSAAETGLDKKSKPLADIQVPIDYNALKNGQKNFEIYCTPCHDRTGAGNGMVTMRGFPHPPSLTSEDAQEKSAGEIYRIITNGQGAMLGYKNFMSTSERWRVVAYVRALALSQHLPTEDLQESDQAELNRAQNETRPNQGPIKEEETK